MSSYRDIERLDTAAHKALLKLTKRELLTLCEFAGLELYSTLVELSRQDKAMLARRIMNCLAN